MNHPPAFAPRTGPARGLALGLGLAAVVTLALGAEPVTLTFPGGAGTVRLERYVETDALLEFVVDSDARIRVRLAPERFRFEAGQPCSVNTSAFDPWLQTPERDGELVLDLDRPRHCTVVIEKAAGGNLLPNAGFELTEANGAPTAWQSENEPDPDRPGTNTAAVTEAVHRGGRRSLRFVKNSGRGGASIRTSEEIPVTAGQTYLVSGYYHAPVAPFGSRAVLLATLSIPNQPPIHFRDDRLEPLMATPTNTWRRAFIPVPVPANATNARLSLVLAARGTPSTQFWDDLEVRIAPSPALPASLAASPARMAPRLSQEELRVLWHGRKAVEVQLPQPAGRSLKVEGSLEALHGYAGSPRVEAWPANSAHAEFLRAGVRLHWIPVSLTQSVDRFGGPIWLADRRYDFSMIDRQLADLLAWDASARVLLDIDLHPYPAFAEVHPEAAWRNARGQRRVGDRARPRDETERRPGEPFQVSLTAPVFRREGAELLRSLGQFLARLELGRAVVGINLSVGKDLYWFHPGDMDGPGELDRSEGNLEAFREWVYHLYGGDEPAFREAWGSPQVSFRTASLPTEDERAPQHYFLDPNNGSDRRVIDANLFVQEGVADTLNRLAKAFREGLGRPAFVTARYPNSLQGHRAWLNQPQLDGIITTPDDGHRTGPGRSGQPATYPASLRVHGKGFLIDLDPRTEPTNRHERETRDLAREFIGAPGPGATADLVRRDLGAALAQGGGARHISLDGAGWSDPALFSCIQEASKAAWRAALEPIPGDTAQVGVFTDETLEAYCSLWDGYGPRVRALGQEASRGALSRSGLTCDHYLLSDIDQTQRPDYRLYVFLSAQTLTRDQIRWIKRYLQGNGRVLVFMHSAGYSLGAGFEQNIRDLTGMTVKVDLEDRIPRHLQALDTDPLSAGLGTLPVEFAGPVFHVEDPGAVPLARLSGTDRLGMAVKRYPDWTAVYISLPGALSPRFLRNLAREAGILPLGPEDDVTYAGNGFVVIQALRPGEKTLRWNALADMFDLTTGTTIARATNTLTLKMEAHETRWLRRLPAAPPPGSALR